MSFHDAAANSAADSNLARKLLYVAAWTCASMPQSKQTGKPYLRRLASYACIIVLLCGAGYVIGANAFLFLHGTALLFKSTNTVNATYSRGYSVWPGVIHVRHMRVVFQDKNVEWSLDLEQATVRVVLAELLGRRFHVKWLKGSGVTFRFRHRIEPESQHKPWVSALPSIPEFPTPAVFEPTVPEPPISDNQYNLWTVHIENVDVAVRELWIQFTKYTGAARARGAFRLVPARTLWVGPASLQLDRGRATLGNAVVAKSVSGTIDCRVDFFDVRIPQGRDVLRYVNTDTLLQASEFSIDPFIQFFERRSNSVIRTAPGALRADIHVRQGRVIPDTTIEYSAGALSIDEKQLRFTAPAARAKYEVAIPNEVTLEGSVNHGTLNSSATIDGMHGKAKISGGDLTGAISVDSASLTVDKLKAVDARAFAFLPSAFNLPATIEHGSLEATLDASHDTHATSFRLTAHHFDFQLKHAANAISAKGTLRGRVVQTHTDRGLVRTSGLSAQFDKIVLRNQNADPSRVNGSLRQAAIDATYGEAPAYRSLDFHSQIASASIKDADRAWFGSSITLDGRLIDERHRARGDVTMTFKELRLGSHDMRLKFRPVARLTIDGFDRRSNQGRARATLDFSAWTASYGDDGGQCSSLNLPNGHIDVVAQLDEKTVSTRLSGRLTNGRFNWGKDFAVSSDLRLASHLLADRVTRKADAISVSVDLRHSTFRSGGGTSEGWQVTSPEVRLGAHAQHGAPLVGTLSLGIEHLSGHIGHASIGTHLDVQVPNFELSADRKKLIFGARVRIYEANLATSEQRITNWWASIDTNSTQLTARQNLDISTDFHARMRDATPGLLLMDKTRHLPNWLLHALPLSAVMTNGMLSRQCKLTAVRFDRLAGGPLTASGALQSATDVVRGAFLVRLNAAALLSAGIEIGPPDAGVSPLVGDDWLRQHTGRLENAAEQILSTPCRVEAERCASSE